MKIAVFVKPGSKKGPLIEAALSVDGMESVVVYLREKPHDGEANEALIRMLSKYYDVPKSLVEIKSGGKSRKKIVEIIGL